MASRSQPNRVTIQEFKPEEIPMSCSWIVVGPPGSGKCLGEGTELLMFDGSIKRVEDVINGDVLMGDDSMPRCVQGVTSGFGKLFQIEQSSGDTYVVNAPHILVLRKTIPPRMYKCEGIEMWNVEWISSDGRRTWTSYTSEEVALEAFNLKRNDEMYLSCQTIEIEAETYHREQHLPRLSGYKGYKADVHFQKGKVSVEERLDFLGKLIDLTDASKSTDRYTISVRNERLADKIKLVSDSLGFHTTLVHDVFLNIPSSSPSSSSSMPSSSSSESSSIVKIVNNEGEEIVPSASKSVYNITIRGNLSRIPVKEPREGLISDSNDSDLTITPIEDGRWFGFELDGNKRFLLRDTTVTHNTTFIENMMYILKDRYPVATAFIGTEGAYERFSQILHPLYVRSKYDEDEEKSHILRQKTCALENGGKHPANYAINVLDDVSDDPKIYRTNVMRGLFKLGSQHWHQLLFVGSQYAIDMPPDVRKSVSYVAIFMEPEDQERKKLYNNFGGLAGSYENFCDLMDQITGDYTCLIFKKRTQTQSLEDNIFWFRGQNLPMWKFGCKEYRKWAEERYDKEYIEDPQV